MTRKKILVTGAAGFIGYHLSRRLLEEGYEVFGIDSINGYYSVQIKHDRISLLQRFDNFSFSIINTCNRTDIDGLFVANNFDMVIHLAAQAGVRYSKDAPHKYVESNLVGFVNVLEACRQQGVKNFVYASSSSVYGNRLEGAFNESEITDSPESFYAATKKANELMAYTYTKQFGIKTIGLRFFSIYGPLGRPDMAYFSFTRKIMKGEAITVFNNGELARDFTYVGDVADGVCRLVQNIDRLDKYKIYNLGNSRPVKIITFIEQLEIAIGKKAVLEYLPMQCGDVLFTGADISAASADFGYHPTTLVGDGLKIFVDWYKNYFN